MAIRSIAIPRACYHDVLEGWESREKARDVYGVVFTGAIDDDTLAGRRRGVASGNVPREPREHA